VVLPATIQDVIGMRGGHRLHVREVQHEFIFEVQHRPNKALQLTANPLRGLSTAELNRYAVRPCDSHDE
jgi:hypothetical protein